MKKELGLTLLLTGAVAASELSDKITEIKNGLEAKGYQVQENVQRQIGSQTYTFPLLLDESIPNIQAGMCCDFYIVLDTIANSAKEDSVRAYGGNFIPVDAGTSVDYVDRAIKHNTSVQKNKQKSIDDKLEIGPNPFNGVTNAKFSVNKKAPVSVQLYSVDGKKAYEMNLGMMDKGQYSIKLGSENLPTGKYMVSLKAGDKEYHKLITLVK